MAHKTLVGGTAYEISGGKTLIGGTVYAKDHGKTLVGGTAYEVGFAPAGATVTIIGNGGNYANVVIDGVTYNTAAEVIVPIGTVINCVTQNRPNYGAPIFYNLERVVYRPNAQYSYTVTGDATIALGQDDLSAIGQMVRGYISIVDGSAPPYATVTITRDRILASNNHPHVTVNGTQHKVPMIVFADIGDAVLCTPVSIDGSESGPAVDGKVFLNGEVVAARDSYTYSLTGDVGIELRQVYAYGSGSICTGDIYITEL